MAKFAVPGGIANQIRHDAGPLVADWDGDGVPDLLVGASDGSVHLFRGRGKQTPPVFGGGETLIDGFPDPAFEPIWCERDAATGRVEVPPLERSRLRPKLAVFDWNGDGKLDLLVGDACFTTSAEPELSESQVRERDELEKQMESIGSNLRRRGDETRVRVRHEVESRPPKAGDLPLRERIDDGFAEELAKDSAYHDLEKQLDGLWRRLAPFKADRTIHGFVWVYLRTTAP